MSGTTFKVVTLLVLITTLILPLGFGQKPVYKRIGLDNLEPTDLVNTKRPSQIALRIAVAGVLSPTETLKSYDPLVSYPGQVLISPRNWYKDAYSQREQMVG